MLLIQHIWRVKFQDKPIVMYGYFKDLDAYFLAKKGWLNRQEVIEITDGTIHEVTEE